MDVLDEVRQTGERFDEIRAESNRVRGGESHAGNARDGANRLQELNKRACFVPFGKFMATVEVDDLSEEGDLTDAFGREGMHFVCDFLDRASAFLSTGLWNDAERAVHIAALHDGYKGRALS